MTVIDGDQQLPTLAQVEGCLFIVVVWTMLMVLTVCRHDYGVCGHLSLSTRVTESTSTDVL